MILALFVVVAALAEVGQCQKGHYIRPLVEAHYPAVTYGLPLYEEVPAAPRLYPALYQTHPPAVHARARKTSRSDSYAQAKLPTTVAAASSQPSPSLQDEVEASHDSSHPILSFRNEMGNDGDYSYNYETADGMKKEETSITTTTDDGKTSRTVRGSYSYPSADGKIVRVDYVADEGGFRATTVTEGDSSTYQRSSDRGYVYAFRAP